MVLSIVSMALFGSGYVFNAMVAAIVLYGEKDLCDDGYNRIGCREVLTINILVLYVHIIYILLSPTSDVSRTLIGQLARVYDLLYRGKSCMSG